MDNRIAIIVLVLILFSCVGKNEEEKKIGESSSVILNRKMDLLVGSYIADNEPGLAVLVSYNGEKLVSKGYGLRDMETKQPITSKTNMRLASVSKQFTALCVLTLIDSGVMSFKQNVYELLPFKIFKNITLENLLNHTAGLPDYYDYFESDWDKDKIVENKHVIEWLKTNPKALFKPGTDYRYSNTGYIVLAAIVEKVIGMEFSEYAKQNLFNKANMKNTNYFNLANPIKIKERAFCYIKDSLKGFEKVDGYFMNGLMGDGAIYSSIDDYYEYDQVLRDKNKSLLKNLDYKIIFEPSSTYLFDGKEKHYAMGWSVTDSTAAHTGGWVGVDTYTKRYLNIPLTLGVFSNRTDILFDRGLWRKIDSLAYATLKNNSKN